MPFISNTPEQQKQMLDEIGLTMDDLFGDIPSQLIAEAFGLPRGLSEQETRNRLTELAQKNATHLTCFLGGGFYDHFIPAAVQSIVS
ncbi:MAG: hypothetical protein JSW59_04450, partial [Phycisphaerales bacterium]